MGDLSHRAREAILLCDVFVAEDTRVGSRLLKHLGASKPIVRLDEHATAASIEKVVGRLVSGEIVVLTSDAGTPGVSDPGAALVDRAREAGVPIDSIPGPSAVTNALALSGFYAQRYAFLGFLSRKANALREELESYRESPLTIVFFESPHRVVKTLRAAFEALGDRRACVCREMTKLHQEVLCGRLSELTEAAWLSKGEYTVVVEGRRRREPHG